ETGSAGDKRSGHLKDVSRGFCGPPELLRTPNYRILVGCDGVVDHFLPRAELGDPAARVLAQALTERRVGEQAVDRGSERLRVAWLDQQAGLAGADEAEQGPRPSGDHRLTVRRRLGRDRPVA